MLSATAASSVESREPVQAPAREILTLHARLQGLRGAFAGRSVLVAGPLARSTALQKLLRRAAARVTAAESIETALQLIARLAIDIVIVECGEDAAEDDAFEATLPRCAATGLAPVLLRLPRQ
jgi:hypothetical protein